MQQDNSPTSIEAVKVASSETLFRTMVYCETLRSYCNIVITPTHFAWVTNWFVHASFPFFPPRAYSAVKWQVVDRIELGFRDPDREKLIRVLWRNMNGQVTSVEMTRIHSFDYWVRQFRKVGFTPTDGNPFHSSLCGAVCDHGPTVWVLAWGGVAFALVMFGQPLVAILFPAIF